MIRKLEDIMLEMRELSNESEIDFHEMDARFWTEYSTVRQDQLDRLGKKTIALYQMTDPELYEAFMDQRYIKAYERTREHYDL